MGLVGILTVGPITLLPSSVIGPFENLNPDPPSKATAAVEVAFFATLTVNTTDDGDDNVCDVAHCSLRDAINVSNATAGVPDVIEFSIPGAGPHTIQPTSALPTITDPVIIDGYTQLGASVNTNGPGQGSNAVLKIELDGSNAGGGADGLQITASNSTVQGLVINRFAVNGVLISEAGATGNVIQGNFIGTGITGTAAAGNGLHGVSIVRAPGNTVGGTTSAARNVISGNSVFGVGIIFSGATGNIVQGNLIGTDVAGTAAVGNGNSGVDLDDTPNNTVGGTGAGARNIISGNTIDGVLIRNTATGNVVQGNYIGTDVTGTTPLGNADRGVHILLGANSNTIGGTTAAGNVISGNTEGVKITGSGSTGNLVQGNLMGTDLNGTTALPNDASGVLIDGAPNNTIGWTASGAGNIISGNSDGVVVMGIAATGNRVVGNYIGTDLTGSETVPNTSVAGVHIEGAPNNEVGGNLVEERNVISGNGDGIFISGSEATGNLIRGNYIGTDAAGSAVLGNDGQGVFISGAADNKIGGTTTGAGNVISGNAEAGIRVSDAGATGNVVEGNYIGTNADGSVKLGNGTGVTLVQALNTIGGTAEEARNIISGNGTGMVIEGSGAVNNVVQGNYIGTDAAGNADLGNDQHGIIVHTNASDNTIGGMGSGEGNTIAFNGGDGVFVETGTGNAILSNSIHSNAGLGIDLGSNDVDTNDDGDGDVGANGLQNFPVVTSVIAGSTTIEGTLNSTADTEFYLEFFTSATCDVLDHGEGERLLETAEVSTDANGDASFTGTSPHTPPANHAYLTATATDPDNNTSEFSACVAVVNDFEVAVSPGSNTVNAGTSAGYTVTVSPLANAVDDAVALTCSGLPNLSACAFAPASVTPGDTETTSTLTVSTTAPSVSLAPTLHNRDNAPLYAGRLGWLWFGTVGVVLGLSFVTRGAPRRKRLASPLILVLVVSALVLYTACGGEEPTGPGNGGTPIPGTPTGSHTFTITASAGALEHSTTATLVVQ
jgi:CSLREA domain-containing protein